MAKFILMDTMWHIYYVTFICGDKPFFKLFIFGVIKNQNWTQGALRDRFLLWFHPTWHLFLFDLKFNSLGGLLVDQRANLTDLRQTICRLGKASNHFWKENSLARLTWGIIFMTEVGTRCPKMGERACVCTGSPSHGLDPGLLFWIYWLYLWKTWNANWIFIWNCIPCIFRLWL